MKTLTFLLAIAFSTAVFSTQAMAENLIHNGGFEQPQTSDFIKTLSKEIGGYYGGASASPFQDWAFGGQWENGSYKATISPEAHSGKASCMITCTTPGRGGLACYPITVKGGTVLNISAWIKANEAVSGRIRFNLEGSPGDGWAQKELESGTYDWKQFSTRVTVPKSKDGTSMQNVVLYIYTSVAGTIWIDDVAAEEVANPSSQPTATTRGSPKSIEEPADSIGYRANVVSPLEKVFLEDDFAATVAHDIALSAARNEYESAQVVIEAPWRPVTIKQVTFSDFQGPDGAKIPSSAMSWNRVAYVRTTIRPPYYCERGQGLYPDPLMPGGEFTVEKLSRAPVWLTIKTPAQCPAGTYTGTMTIQADAPQKACQLPISLTVWNFALPQQTHLRTMTWLNSGSLAEFYGLGNGGDAEKKAQVMRRFQDILLTHRLGPGGSVAEDVSKKADGTYDFSKVDDSLDYLFKGGMNAFLMATAPNLERAKQKEYTPQFIQDFTEKIAAYSKHLKAKGWLDGAYVYTYDEAPKSAWPEVKKIAAAIKKAAPEVKVFQCLNEPEGVKELTGVIDVFDVYVTQYHRAGVAQSQQKGGEVWLAICCYPMDRPNFFLEYPLLDMRIVPWICWKYKASGFEYWSTTSWGPNSKGSEPKWPQRPWVANAFGKYNGDGYLTYPGLDLTPYSSIRFEALRDGFEDYEYFYMLSSLLKDAEKSGATGAAVDKARKLLDLEGMVDQKGAYTQDLKSYQDFRRQVAQAIEGLQKPAK